jgi:ABC-type amino acid transport substrate-binding protein
MLMLALVLAAAACGKKKEVVPSAADSMKKHNKVCIITDPYNLPFEFGLDTGVQGLDIDIGNALAKDLNIDVNWQKFNGVDHLYEVLGKGEAEILISALWADPKREDQFAFSTPYYDSGDAIATKMDKMVDDIGNLSGRRVGVATGRFGDQFMAAKKGINIVKFPTIDHALGALNRTEIDAVVADKPILTYLISESESYHNLTVSPSMIDHYKYAAVVRKGETDLLNSINKSIDRLKSSGELVALQTKWFKDADKKVEDKRQSYKKEEALRKSPKTISVTIQRRAGAPIKNLDNLDGFQLVLEGTGGQYKSTGIRTDGDRGNCEFKTPVAPGEYKLDMMSIFHTTAKVVVPDAAKSSLAMEVNIGRDISIVHPH